MVLAIGHLIVLSAGMYDLSYSIFHTRFINSEGNRGFTVYGKAGAINFET